MGLCKFFVDPAEARCCRQGVDYQTLAGGGAHNMVLRLVCIPLEGRTDIRPCAKFEPQGEHDGK